MLPQYTNSLEKSDDTRSFDEPSTKVKLSKWLHLLLAAFIAIPLIYSCTTTYRDNQISAQDNPDSICPLLEKTVPKSFNEDNSTVFYVLTDPSFKNRSITKLSNAVKIPTEIYDDMPNPKLDDTPESLYKAYEDFHAYLKDSFPLIYKSLKVERVNEYSLIVTWQGSDSSLKPLLLAAHLDVVPVQKETIKDWTHPPFSGHFDGEFIWGRGATDCKLLLVGLMETFELLLEKDFKPNRTTVLAFGYDEEASGMFGAYEISNVLLERYGKNSFYAIVDEGSAGFVEMEGRKFILPATGEKGYLDAMVELTTPGGHSSVPPDHTSIGITSELIQVIERNPYKGILTNANPILSQLQCIAKHSKTIDKQLKSDILKAQLDVEANKRVISYLEQDPEYSYYVKTSQAIDVINGGAKSNALPEHVQILVNHRIAIESSVEETANNLLSHINKISDMFDLGYIMDGKTYKDPTVNGYFNFSFVDPLPPAPITPTNDDTWELFGGTLRHFFEDIIFLDSNEEFIVSPGIMGGNTDTKSYWKLTDHIYRYSPGHVTVDPHVHSVDERVNYEALLQTVAFFHEYIHILNE